jgi:hypothetical protein
LTRLSFEFSGLVRCFGGGNGSGRRVGACTLLGPEGPDASDCFGGWVWTNPLGLFWLPAFVGCWDWYRPYFENYTVDASILETMRYASFHKQ